MGAYEDRLAAKKQKLENELAALKQEEQRAKKLPADVVLHNLIKHSDPAIRKETAALIMKGVGTAGEAASLLKIPVSELYTALHSSPDGQK
jgi:sugar-specific transcriptional regulator TrmB